MSKHSLTLILEANTRGAVSGIDGVSNKIKGIGAAADRAERRTSNFNTKTRRGVESISRQLASARSHFLGFLAAGQVVGLARDIVSMADSWKAVSAQLKVSTNDHANLSQMQDEVLRIARSTGAQLESTGKSYARVNQAVEAYGGTLQDTSTITQALNDALNINRATTAESSAAQIQFSQALGAGVLRGEEFNSLMENATPLMRALADQIADGNVGALRAMAQEGQLTSEVVIPAIISASEQLRQTSQGMGLTVQQNWQNLRTAMMEYLGGFDQAVNLTGGISAALSTLSEHIGFVVNALGVLAAALTGLAATKTINWLQSLVSGMQQTAVANRTAAAAATTAAAAEARKAQSQLAAAQVARGAAAAEMASAKANLTASRSVDAQTAALARLRAAQTGVAASSRALSAAQAQAAAATAAASTATAAATPKLLSLAGAAAALKSALALLGGPIGILITGLGSLAVYALNARSEIERLNNTKIQATDIAGKQLTQLNLQLGEVKEKMEAVRKTVGESSPEYQNLAEKAQGIEKAMDAVRAAYVASRQEGEKVKDGLGDLSGETAKLVDQLKGKYLPELQREQEYLKNVAALQAAASRGDQQAVEVLKKLSDEYQRGGESVKDYRKELEKKKAEIQSVIDNYSPLEVAQRNYENDLNTIKSALDRNMISEDRYTQLVQAAGMEYANAAYDATGYSEQLKTLEEQTRNNEEAARQQQQAYQSLRDELYPVEALTRDYHENVATLTATLGDNGQMTDELRDALEKLGEKQVEQIDNLTGMAEGNKEVKDAAEDASGQYAEVWKSAFNRLDGIAKQGWRDMIDGTKSVGQQLKDWFKDLLAELAHTALTKPIVIGITNAFTGGGSGGGSNMLGSMLGSGVGYGANYLASLFGGAGSQQAAMLAAQTGAFGMSGAASTAGALGAGGALAGAASVALPVAAFAALVSATDKKTAKANWLNLADSSANEVYTERVNVGSRNFGEGYSYDRTQQRWEDGVAATGAYGTIGAANSSSHHINAKDYQSMLDAQIEIDNAMSELFADQTDAIKSALDGYSMYDKHANSFAYAMGDRFSVILDTIGVDYADAVLAGLDRTELATIGAQRLMILEEFKQRGFAGFDVLADAVVAAGDGLAEIAEPLANIPNQMDGWKDAASQLAALSGKAVPNLDALAEQILVLDGLEIQGTSPEQIMAEINAWVNEKGGQLLAAVMPEFAGAIEGAGSRAAEIVQPLIGIASYLNEDWQPAVADTFRTLADDAYTAVQDQLAAYDGSVESTQQLAGAVQERYQIEAQLLQQIDAVSSSVADMTGGISERIDRLLRSDAEQVAWLTEQQNTLRQQLLNATDPAEINNLVQEVTRLSGEQIGLLGEEGLKIAVEEYGTLGNRIKDFMDQVNTIAQEKLAASKTELQAQNTALSDGITESLSTGTAAFIAGAESIATSIDQGITVQAAMAEQAEKLAAQTAEMAGAAGDRISGIAEESINAVGDLGADIASMAEQSLNAVDAVGAEIAELSAANQESISELIDGMGLSIADMQTAANEAIDNVSGVAGEIEQIAQEQAAAAQAAINEIATGLGGVGAELQTTFTELSNSVGTLLADSASNALNGMNQSLQLQQDVAQTVADLHLRAAQSHVDAAARTDQAASNTNVAATSMNNAAGAIIQAAQVLASASGGYQAT